MTLYTHFSLQAAENIVDHNGWLNCETHCWCVLDPEEHRKWELVIHAMKDTPHEHGTKEACTGCMIEDGRITF